MCGFAPHRQGQYREVCSRCHNVAPARLSVALPDGAGCGYRPTEPNPQSCPERAKGFLPALFPSGGRLRMLGEVR